MRDLKNSNEMGSRNNRNSISKTVLNSLMKAHVLKAQIKQQKQDNFKFFQKRASNNKEMNEI